MVIAASKTKDDLVSRVFGIWSNSGIFNTKLLTVFESFMDCSMRGISDNDLILSTAKIGKIPMSTI